MQIFNARGNGLFGWGITKGGLGRVASMSQPIQLWSSLNEGNAYHVKSLETLSATTLVLLHFQNTSTTKFLAFTGIKHQLIGASGGTAFPNINNRLTMGFGRIYTSGGSQVTPINLKTASGNKAPCIIYNNNPTLSGTSSYIDDWYTKADGDMNVSPMDGSIILAPNSSFEIIYISDQTGGSIYCQASFIIMDPDNL